MPTQQIRIERFEIATAPDGDVAVCVISRAALPDPARLVLEGRDLMIGRDRGLAMRFVGISRDDVEALRGAPRILRVISGREPPCRPGTAGAPA